VARRRDRLGALAERLQGEAGVEAGPLTADLTDAEALSRVELRIAEDGGYRPFVEVEPRVIDDLIGVHVRAVALSWLLRKHFPASWRASGVQVQACLPGLVYGVPLGNVSAGNYGIPHSNFPGPWRASRKSAPSIATTPSTSDPPCPPAWQPHIGKWPKARRELIAKRAEEDIAIRPGSREIVVNPGLKSDRDRCLHLAAL
jgi:hypothetical protein